MQKVGSYLTVSEFALLVRLSAQTIYNGLSAGGQGFPPTTKLPKSRRVLFHVSDVESWIDQHKKRGASELVV